MPGKNILLIEPAYKNKYPPLGLMKLAQYHGPLGKRDRVTFMKGEDPSVLKTAWDRIYVTTLFSFEFVKISRSIDFAILAANGHVDKVFVGGIAASLMYDRFISESRWTGVRFIKGLLSEPAAIALRLDEFSDELYSNDRDSVPIEELTPDYSILDQIDYKYPVSDAYFVYASRGCIRSCNFCGVPKLEGKLKETESISSVVHEIERLYGAKKDLILMDNNVVAAANFKRIIAEIRDLGFTPGAKLQRGRFSLARRVDFNQGVDARILCKDSMYLRELSTIAIRPLRIAFDHWGLQKPYEQAVRYAHDFGLNDLSNYMLYNFHDSPTDLYMRMKLNVSLNIELGIRIYSFPMRYQPTDLPHRTYVSEKWTRYQLRSMQIILQATHGVVSGEPEFFNLAFGDTSSAFSDLLMRPHHYIFNREYYDRYEGQAELEAFRGQFGALSSGDREELLMLLSSCDPREFAQLSCIAVSAKVKSILNYYVAPTKQSEGAIWQMQRLRKMARTVKGLSEEEFVEDAGLEEDTDLLPSDVIETDLRVPELTR